MSQPLAPDQSDIKVIARPLKDSILIRWAPLNYSAWQVGNQYGYTLVRYTIIRDSILLQKPELAQLNNHPIKPLPLNDWEKYVNTNKYAAIAAQAIYGSSFETDAGPGLNPSAAYNKSQEQQQRFSFALYSADISPEVAQISGLWFTDKTAKENEKYLYRVFANVPVGSKVKLDTGYIFTAISEYLPLPKPVELQANFGDRHVQLNWNAFVHDNIYMAWWVERSDDGGKTFKRINKEPLTQMASEEDFFPELVFKSDSLPENQKEYHYRVKGITSFGEEGPYSEVVKGMGREIIKSAPMITKQEIVGNYVKIEWNFPNELEKSIDGFKILRANNHKTGFIELAILSGSDRTFTDKNPLGTGYYKVTAWKQSSIPKESYPVLVQLTDSIPPVAPTGLTGLADTSGTVNLTWTSNKEEDIYGYRLFRSLSGNDQYVQLSSRPVQTPAFVDTLNKMDLNKKVYYKVMAVDQRQNESGFSEILVVEKPDIIPPSPPVFKSAIPTEQGVQLKWINSSSNDIAAHVIYRSNNNDTSWVLVKEIKATKLSTEANYLDKNVLRKDQLTYKIVAKDFTGNESKPAFSNSLTISNNSTNNGITKVKHSYDSNKARLYINWTNPEGEIKNILVYRETSDKKYSVYETLDGKVTAFEDYGMKAGKTYAYRLKVIYQDGSISSFSEEVKVKL